MKYKIKKVLNRVYFYTDNKDMKDMEILELLEKKGHDPFLFRFAERKDLDHGWDRENYKCQWILEIYSDQILIEIENFSQKWGLDLAYNQIQGYVSAVKEEFDCKSSQEVTERAKEEITRDYQEKFFKTWDKENKKLELDENEDIFIDENECVYEIIDRDDKFCYALLSEDGAYIYLSEEDGLSKGEDGQTFCGNWGMWKVEGEEWHDMFGKMYGDDWCKILQI